MLLILKIKQRQAPGDIFLKFGVHLFLIAGSSKTALKSKSHLPCLTTLEFQHAIAVNKQ